MNMIRALKILSKDTGRQWENSAKPKPVASKKTRIADLPVLLSSSLVIAAVLAVLWVFFMIIKEILTSTGIR